MMPSGNLSIAMRKDKLLLFLLLLSFSLSLALIILVFLESYRSPAWMGSILSGLQPLRISPLHLTVLAGVTALQLLLAVWLGGRAVSSMTRLERAAMLDSLSGLPNRRALRTEMVQSVKGGQTAAIAFIDLDSFKAVNDTFGHDVGDSLIRSCSHLISKCCDANTLVSRLGGDEFAVFSAGQDCESRVEKVALLLLASLAFPLDVDGRSLVVGASIGLAACRGEKVTATELMRRADLAMYAAKRAGKMRALWFEPSMNAIAVESREMAEALKKAIERGELEVFYQPQVNAKTEIVEGVEALARWRSLTDDQEIPPTVFIPIAEEAGLIESLGLLVLRKACLDALDWPTLRLTVNVSTAQLRNPCFPKQVRGVLEETGLAAERLELEVTESLLVKDPNLAKRIMAELRELGVRFSLDDFGTGFASIGFLRQFDFETLKLDRSLVVEAEKSEAARALVNASISIADVLKMNVTAEGIETRLQADLMRIAGCKYLQGWLFARPLSSTSITTTYIRSKPVMKQVAL
jgi:diguanylate cyclase (GGDEF)-like protein